MCVYHKCTPPISFLASGSFPVASGVYEYVEACLAWSLSFNLSNCNTCSLCPYVHLKAHHWLEDYFPWVDSPLPLGTWSICLVLLFLQVSKKPFFLTTQRASAEQFPFLFSVAHVSHQKKQKPLKFWSFTRSLFSFWSLSVFLGLSFLSLISSMLQSSSKFSEVTTTTWQPH